jgi:thiazole synthase
MEEQVSELDELVIGGRTFRSRLFIGTGKFASPEVMARAVVASGAELVTVALRRMRVNGPAEADALLRALELPGVSILPNTSGVRDAREAVVAAQLAREAVETNWVKLEIHPDVRHLLPDPVETLRATELLAKLGFVVLPYCGADPVLCRRLEEAGAAAVMPLASPIGSNRGLETRGMLELIIAQSGIPVVVDAGLGAPSHAAAAMEIGADAVLVNTAIAVAGDPESMAAAFAEGVRAGRRARVAGLEVAGHAGAATSPSEELVRGLS